jgi:DUF1365 family protein
MTRSCLYHGSVRHVRSRPRRHALRYRAFWLLLDLDERAAVARRLRLLSFGRFNLFGFDERDHGDGTPGGLRAWVANQLRQAGIAADGGVSVLCMPRVLGYVFNPISVYLCRRADGTLAAVLYEVNNTFGQRHCYLIPATGNDAVVRQACGKHLYVSPFLPMELRYRFRLTPPDARVALAIDAVDAQGPLLSAALTGRRAALTDAALLRAFVTVPLLTLKVIAAIHWEALLLWRKRVRLVPRPAPPASPVTFVRPDAA